MLILIVTGGQQFLFGSHLSLYCSLITVVPCCETIITMGVIFYILIFSAGLELVQLLPTNRLQLITIHVNSVTTHVFTSKLPCYELTAL